MSRLWSYGKQSAVIHEVVPPDTGSVFRAMQALRANLDDEESFALEVDEVQRPEGYRLVGVFEEGEPEAATVDSAPESADLRQQDCLRLCTMSMVIFLA